MIIELKKNKIIKTLKGHKSKVLTIKRIIHPQYGECLISQDSGFSSIKIWKVSK